VGQLRIADRVSLIAPVTAAQPRCLEGDRSAPTEGIAHNWPLAETGYAELLNKLREASRLGA
jgi:hypothetical protein